MTYSSKHISQSLCRRYRVKPITDIPTLRYSPVYVASELARRSRAPERLRPFLAAMLHVGIAACEQRGYTTPPAYVAFHLPMEVIATAFGRDVKTIHRWATALAKLRYLDWAPHYGKRRGQTAITGTVWAVRLTGTPRLCLDDLRHPWRNLDGDISQGLTAFRLYSTRAMSESIKGPQKVINTELLLNWGLRNYTSELVNPTPTFANPTDLLEILYLADAPRGERAESVDRCAHMIVAKLGDDNRNLNCWRRVLWNALRAVDAGRNSLHWLYNTLARAIDVRKHSTNNAAAWFIYTLREQGVFLQRQHTPVA